MKILDETNMFITQSLLSSNDFVSSVTSSNDTLGKSEPAKTIPTRTVNEIRQHINSFPACESHYTRWKSEKKYLPPFLNLALMCKLYRESLADSIKPVSRFVYEREFHKMNISFKQPKIALAINVTLYK